MTCEAISHLWNFRLLVKDSLREGKTKSFFHEPPTTAGDSLRPISRSHRVANRRRNGGGDPQWTRAPEIAKYSRILTKPPIAFLGNHTVMSFIASWDLAIELGLMITIDGRADDLLFLSLEGRTNNRFQSNHL